MPLYIRDETINDLAEKLQKALKARTKTDAVRIALAHELERQKGQKTLMDKISDLHKKAAGLGLPNPAFDMKKFSDEQSGDL